MTNKESFGDRVKREDHQERRSRVRREVDRIRDRQAASIPDLVERLDLQKTVIHCLQKDVYSLRTRVALLEGGIYGKPGTSRANIEKNRSEIVEDHTQEPVRSDQEKECSDKQSNEREPGIESQDQTTRRVWGKP